MANCSWCQQPGSETNPLYPYDIGSRMHARCAIAAESGELPPSWNAYCDQRGLWQFAPSEPIPSEAFDVRANLRWMMNYIRSRYGSPTAALGLRPYDWGRDGL